MADVQIIEPVLLAALAKQGIDAGSVALQRDYAPRSLGKGYSPYARTYRDAVSGKNYSVISGLPGCDAYGQSHELAWTNKNSLIESGNNSFHIIIDKVVARLLALSDQPTGAKKDDEVVFHPQLYIDDVEILPLSDMPRLLETDPINVNYHNNTLEWDYGVCLRRIRLIEGRFLGSWVFLTDPKGDVLIKYNQSGKLRLRLQYARDTDTEFIPKAFFARSYEWPVIISDSATFYPDANPETSSVDGICYHYISAGASWGTLVAGAGNGSSDSAVYDRACGWDTDDETNKFQALHRSIFLFDTSSLDDSAMITAATLSLRGYAAVGTEPDVNIYSSAPASNTALATGDFDSLGSTAFCDTTITSANWSTSGYNDFVFNATGLAAITKTGVSKFGGRDASHDVANSSPSWSYPAWPRLQCYFAEQGTGYQPKLVVTYSTGVTEKSAVETGSGAEASSAIAIIKDDETGAGNEVKTSGYPVVTMGGAETGSGNDAKVTGQPLVVTIRTETGSGLESLGSRNLGQTEAGSGLESLGSRMLGRNETGAGLDTGSLLAAFAGNEAGSGAETALRAVAVLSGDTGLGAELSGMLKDAVAGDSGAGTDALKWMKRTADSSAETRLPGGADRAGRPSRKTRMPSRRINL